jgi:hypothetical protein
MKRLPVILLAAMLVVTSCATSRREKTTHGNGPGVFQPKPLDDEWTKWIVGEWEGSVEGDAGQGWSVTIELALNGQFLIFRSQADLTTMPPEQIQYLKEHMHATDEGIERFQSMPFRELEIYTVDPRSGEIIGYLFDSLRCVAEGRGKRQGNKEVMDWQWSVCGQGTSTRITERVSENECTITQKDTSPDGTITEGAARMTRCKKETR